MAHAAYISGENGILTKGTCRFSYRGYMIGIDSMQDSATPVVSYWLAEEEPVQVPDVEAAIRFVDDVRGMVDTITKDEVRKLDVYRKIDSLMRTEPLDADEEKSQDKTIFDYSNQFPGIYMVAYTDNMK